MSTPTPPVWHSIVRRFIIPIGAMVIAFAAGWTVGGGRAGGTDWTDATVKVSGTEATAEVGSSTYEIPPVVPTWLKDGKWQDSGWPTCLTDNFSGTLPVLVSDTTVDGTSIKTIVAVDCD